MANFYLTDVGFLAGDIGRQTQTSDLDLSGKLGEVSLGGINATNPIKDIITVLHRGFGALYPQDPLCGWNWQDLILGYLEGVVPSQTISDLPLEQELLDFCNNRYIESIAKLIDLGLTGNADKFGPVKGSYHLEKWPYRERMIHTENILQTGIKLLEHDNSLIAENIWRAVTQYNSRLDGRIDLEDLPSLDDFTIQTGKGIIKKAWKFIVLTHRLKDDLKSDDIEHWLNYGTKIYREERVRSEQNKRIGVAFQLALMTIQSYYEFYEFVRDPNSLDESIIKQQIQQAWEFNPLNVFLCMILHLLECASRLCWGRTFSDIFTKAPHYLEVEKLVPICRLQYSESSEGNIKLLYEVSDDDGIPYPYFKSTPPLNDNQKSLISVALGEEFLGLLSAEQEINLIIDWKNPNIKSTTSRPESEENDKERTISLISGLNSIKLSSYRIVGKYMRFAERTVSNLRGVKENVFLDLLTKSDGRKNYLMWAPPGHGKTFFAEQIRDELDDEIQYIDLNLNKMSEEKFRLAIEKLKETKKPCLCFVDEIGKKSDQLWPFEILCEYLDINLEAEQTCVFMLAGSSGGSSKELQLMIKSRENGGDLLDRIPNTNFFSIPLLEVGDRLVVGLSHIRALSQKKGNEINFIEKLALCYIMRNPDLSSARQISDFIVKAIARVKSTSDRLMYDDLFDSGNLRNKAFWDEVDSDIEKLSNKFVLIED